MSKLQITGVILAGGQARRMNYQDKGLQLFQNQMLISYSLNAIRPLVDDVIINANRNVETYQTFGVPVISDLTPDFSGALAGILAIMNYSKADLLLVIPCDAPFIQTKQLQQLLSNHQNSTAQISVACTGEQIHSVFLVIETNLKVSLKNFLAQGERKIRKFLEQHNTNYVDFDENASGFENINTFEELANTKKPAWF